MLALAFWYVLLVIETIIAIMLFAVLTPFLLGFLVLGFYLVITKNNKVSDWLICLAVASVLAFLNLRLVEGIIMCFKALF